MIAGTHTPSIGRQEKPDAHILSVQFRELISIVRREQEPPTTAVNTTVITLHFVAIRALHIVIVMGNPVTEGLAHKKSPKALLLLGGKHNLGLSAVRTAASL